MKASPLFVGACAFASVAGAIGGATTNTTPIQNAGIGMNMLPGRQIAFNPSDGRVLEFPSQDHYPIDTPQGRIEVADLSTRGLYAQQRFGWRAANYDIEPEPAFVENEPVDRFAEAGNAPPSIDADPIAAPIEPLDLEPASHGRAGRHRAIELATAPNSQG